MNLIEQLGGYSAAKAEANAPVKLMNSFSYEQLDKELLECRRENNIFEVGDVAVNSRGDESRLLKIWRVNICNHSVKLSIADYDADGLAGWSRFHCLRHATDEEIKAGHRL